MAAPEGCIVNCKYPSPVNARHVVGMYVPMPILKALYHIMPERVLAEGSGAVWTIQIQGKNANGTPFTSSMFNYSGGMGARETKPGPSATCYPTGVAAVPIEVLEASMPIVFTRKEIRDHSGGAGRSRGGDGQIIEWRMNTDSEWLLNAVASRTELAPQGLAGGAPGEAGRFLINGKVVNEARKIADEAGRQGDAGNPRRRRLRPAGRVTRPDIVGRRDAASAPISNDLLKSLLQTTAGLVGYDRSGAGTSALTEGCKEVVPRGGIEPPTP